MIRIVLPAHLRTLSGLDAEVQVQVHGTVTQSSVLDALESRYPALRGTIRDQATLRRRPFVRFFACEQDTRLTRARKRRCPSQSPPALSHS